MAFPVFGSPMEPRAITLPSPTTAIEFHNECWDRERLKGLNLNFKDFMTLIEEAMDLVRGGDDDTPSGE